MTNENMDVSQFLLMIKEKDKKINELQMQYDEIMKKNDKIKRNLEQLKKAISSTKENNNELFSFRWTKDEIIFIWNDLFQNNIKHFVKDCELSHKTTFCLINQLFFIIQQNIQKYIQSLYQKFASVFRLPQDGAKCNEIQAIVNNFIKDNFGKIFIHNNSRDELNNEKIIDEFFAFFRLQFKKEISKKMIQQISKNKNNFIKIIIQIKTLIYFRELSETKIIFSIQNSKKEDTISISKINFKKFINISSFETNENNEDINGIIILDPPKLQNGFLYSTEMLPIVYISHPQEKKIINPLEKIFDKLKIEKILSNIHENLTTRNPRETKLTLFLKNKKKTTQKTGKSSNNKSVKTEVITKKSKNIYPLKIVKDNKKSYKSLYNYYEHENFSESLSNLKGRNMNQTDETMCTLNNNNNNENYYQITSRTSDFNNYISKVKDKFQKLIEKKFQNCSKGELSTQNDKRSRGNSTNKLMNRRLTSQLTKNIKYQSSLSNQNMKKVTYQKNKSKR